MDLTETPREQSFDAVLDRLPAWRDSLNSIRELLLANLAIVSEIPAPTFHEEQRAAFVLQRFGENGLHSVSTDEMGNAVGVHAGRSGERQILVAAHMDTTFPETANHTVTILPDRVTGVGVADNALGVAAMITLPRILRCLEIELASSLVLIGTTRSLGRGNLGGLRFFLDNLQAPIRQGVYLEGVSLGRLSLSSLGMLTGEIRCEVPEEYDWTRFGASGAIAIMNDVIDRILGIPVPHKPRVTIVLGSIEGGRAYNRVATDAVLRFEVRGESDELVVDVENRLRQIVVEVAGKTKARVTLDTVARSRCGSVPGERLLGQRVRAVMEKLGIQPHFTPSTSELSCFIEKQIPAVKLALTTGGRVRLPDEWVDLDPVFTGIMQVVGTLLALDGGFCDES